MEWTAGADIQQGMMVSTDPDGRVSASSPGDLPIGVARRFIRGGSTITDEPGGSLISHGSGVTHRHPDDSPARTPGAWHPWQADRAYAIDPVGEGLHAARWYWVAISPPNIVTIARWDAYVRAFSDPHSGGFIPNVYAWADANRPDPPTREETATWLPT